MKLERSEQEINDIMNRCSEKVDAGETIYPGVTYEQGVLDALEWATDKDYVMELD